MAENPIWMRKPSYRVVRQVDERGLELIVLIDGGEYHSEDAGRKNLGVPMTRLSTPASSTSVRTGGRSGAA